MENLIKALADTGIVNWQQGSTHAEGRAILWRHGHSIYSTIGTWDEYRRELDEDEVDNPFASRTREVSLEPINPREADSIEQTLSEAILWREVGSTFEETPGGDPNPKTSLVYDGKLALVAALAEHMIYVDTTINTNSFLRAYNERPDGIAEVR